MRIVSLPGIALFITAAFAQTTPIDLRVDATEAPQRLFHVRMTMAVKPGPMTLLYPKWIPGEHMPSGPIVNLVGLQIKGAGQSIPWKRDNLNMFAFHISVPASVSSLDIAFDYISPPEGGAFSAGASATTELAVLNWNQLLLYPEGTQADQLQIKAALKVPKSWRYGTALPIQRESGDEIEFKPASVTTIVDSPLSMGAHYRTVDLGDSNRLPHLLHLAGDSERAIEITPEQVTRYKNLVTETGALFGARHYRGYHFLFTLSDHTPAFGLEHHESSDDRQGERALVDPAQLKAFAYLLPHEMVHSWNGKYRRPAGLATGGFDAPMVGDLLWVYEGLTNYLGEVLAARSELWTPEEYREQLAITAASLDSQSGRAWRPLEDTAIAAQLLYSAGSDYGEYRRGVDYYPEGTLIWLEADVKIRQLSKGSKSLDDFCRLFHGGASGKPDLKSYTFADVVAVLNAVQAFDWRGFLHDRVQAATPRAPLGGIDGGGWKLVYNDKRSDFWGTVEEFHKTTDLTYSIGLTVKEDGSVVDVSLNGPSRKAGIAPSTKLIAVNGRQFTPIVLREAVQKTATGGKLDLLVKSGEYFHSHSIDYRGGERFPHLERTTGDDLITAIVKPAAKK